MFKSGKRQIFPKGSVPILSPMGKRKGEGIKGVDSCATEQEKSSFLEKLNCHEERLLKKI